MALQPCTSPPGPTLKWCGCLWSQGLTEIRPRSMALQPCPSFLVLFLYVVWNSHLGDECRDQAQQYGSSLALRLIDQGALRWCGYLRSQELTEMRPRSMALQPCTSPLRQNYVEVVRLLVESGADRNQATQYGTSALRFTSWIEIR